jgi:hypothetical protein
MEKALIKMWKAINHNSQTEPISAELFELIGCIYYKWGDYENALMYHEKALLIRKEKIGKRSLK